MILAGDVGGTKTLIEVGALRHGIWQPSFGCRYAAADHTDLHDVLRHFLRDWRVQGRSPRTLDRACLGVAGPAFNDRAEMTNLPWVIDGKAIGTDFDIPWVRVVNDFAAAASGIELLDGSDLAVLQTGEPVPAAPRLVIGAGTGLGVAYLIWNGNDYQVIAGETGHTAFAPSTITQSGLWRELHTHLGRVTMEDIVSGPGLARIHEFVLRDAGVHLTGTPVTPATITRAALDTGDALSVRTLDLFIECYGEAAGNCALALLTRGGVYITGGIAPKILPRLRAGGFMVAFNAKGAHSDVVRKIPVSVVTNERLGLLGAALIASRS